MPTIRLKNNNTATDPRLGRIPEFDKRSLEYPIRALVLAEQASKPRSYTWRVNKWLDQGMEGACVGFSWTHELAARPMVVSDVDNLYARGIYKEAQKVDEWPGEDYEGTSVLAGAKVVQKLGHMEEYRWAFGLNDLILAVGYKGPAVLGINWYEPMFSPDEKGFIHVDGGLAGGHAILCYRVNVKQKFFGLWNSWGDSWGLNGACLVSFDDMERLLSEDGEACIPVHRLKVKA
jgi:hypothetical protein